MASALSIDIGTVDFYLDDLAEELIDQQDEGELLVEMANRFSRFAAESVDEKESAFFREAAAKCSELAKWFQENGT